MPRFRRVEEFAPKSYLKELLFFCAFFLAAICYALYSSMAPMNFIDKVPPNAKYVGLYNWTHDRAYHEREIQKVNLTQDAALEFYKRYYALTAPPMLRWEPPDSRDLHGRTASNWTERIYKKAYEFPSNAWQVKLQYGAAKARAWAFSVNVWLSTHGRKHGLPFSWRFDNYLEHWEDLGDEVFSPEVWMEFEKPILGDWIQWFYAKDSDKHYQLVMDSKPFLNDTRKERWGDVEAFFTAGAPWH